MKCCLGSLIILFTSAAAWAQVDPAGPMNRITSAGIRDSTMIDLSVPSVNDPAAIEMLFTEGNSIASILDGLKEKGFHIQYKEKHFTPEMTLVSLPTGTRIDEVLREILEPWNFRVYRSPMGQWIVTPNKKRGAPPTPATRELLDHYKNVHHPDDATAQRSDEQ